MELVVFLAEFWRLCPKGQRLILRLSEEGMALDDALRNVQLLEHFWLMSRDW